MATADDARRVMALLDLTELSDECTEGDVRALCTRAVAGPVPVAAVCVWPEFVALSRTILGGSGVRVATVVNFPHGGSDQAATLLEVDEALADGADEIDLVLPYHALLAGDRATPSRMVTAVRQLVTHPFRLKVILETGELVERSLIVEAANLAIDAGAHFIKSSTGKTAVSATPGAVEAMLEVIVQRGGTVGIKPSGGIRTLAQAMEYLELAERRLGAAWVTPEHFRFGASGVYDALIAAIESEP